MRRFKIKKPNRQSTFSSGQLLWSLLFLTAVSLPLTNDLPLWPVVIVVLTAVWRWRLHQRGGLIPLSLVRIVWTLLNVGIVIVVFRSISGLEPGSSLLLIMAAMKLMESTNRRDLMVIVFMSFFLILSNFLFDQTLLSAAYCAMMVWLGVSAMIQINRAGETDPPMVVLKESGRMLMQALPLMAILFILFPRVPGPFWALPTSSQGKTGLSNSMEPGSISSLLESSDVAFRVYFESEPPPRASLYWRGPVLEKITTGTWRPRTTNLLAPTVLVGGDKVEYEIILEPHQQQWALGLDIADKNNLPKNIYMNQSGQLMSERRIAERTRLKLNAYTNYKLEPKLSDSSRRINLDTDGKGNPRTRKMVAEWQPENAAPTDIINQALLMFNQQLFSYTLEPKRLGKRNSTDEFLFETREGFCEHYASAFTLMMRYAGIPARVVTGYMGGELNAFGEHMTVWQSDAHAWSEVWLENQGWVRIDPTSAVAPERVELGVAAALGNDSLPSLMMHDLSLVNGLRHTMDIINANWNYWILGYGEERQWEVLGKLGMRTPNTTQLVIVMAIACALFLAILAFWLNRNQRRAPNDPVQRIWYRYLAKLNRNGIDTPLFEGATNIARRASLALPDHAETISAITEIYLESRYGEHAHDKYTKALKALVKSIPSGRLFFRQQAKLTG